MPIIDFEFEDLFNQWCVKRFELSDFNLLVGRSGVGKTRVLNALQAVRALAIGRGKRRLYRCKWTITLDSDNQRFRWAASTGETPANLLPSLPFFYHPDEVEEPQPEPIQLMTEHIEVDGHLLVQRSSQGIKVDGHDIPALKTSESVISMLREDERIQPLFRTFQRFLPSRSHLDNLTEVLSARKLHREEERFAHVDQLREDDHLSLVVKARILQEKFPQVFTSFVESYQEIFESVENIRISWNDEILSEEERERISLPPFQVLLLLLKEKGIDHWIPFERLSSGMQLTLIHLLKLRLASPGTVILVDEYENSLGVNCLGDLTDHLRNETRGLQFILTSHHPYVINNLSKDYWKIVTRRGSVVQVRNATDFPELDTRSHQAAFLQLLQVIERESEAA